MKSAPSVQIVLVNYRGWRDTIDCVGAVRALTYPNARLTVVDNASPDDSVPRLRAALPDLDLVEMPENRGFAGGNNPVVCRAMDEGADYVWLLNNDTVPAPDALDELIALAESDARIGAVGSVLYFADDPSRIQGWGGGWVSLWTGLCGHHHDAVPASRVHYVTGASLLLRTAALREVGALDESFFMYWEDTDLSFRLRKAGWRIAVAPKSRIVHRESGTLGRANPLLDRYYNASAVRFFRRHAPVPLVPILVGSAARFVQRAARRQWHRAWAVLAGTLVDPWRR